MALRAERFLGAVAETKGKETEIEREREREVEPDYAHLLRQEINAHSIFESIFLASS